MFYRLLKFIALPIHPLFVYDGRHKPPFKRGKAVSGRSYGSAPIIRLSKTLIDLFKFPRHDAPGEAEAECARLQRAGIVDAVMTNDVDALMFGSTFTIMNFSKDSASGTNGATHITCYRTEEEHGLPANVPFDRAGMILFAMLSGGDYLPSGVPKCGSKLAAEIAKAGFGSDLLEIINSDAPGVDAKLDEWRTRLQFELDENESGYFQTKHKAVRIPDTFPDRTILSYYANPVVSTSDDVEALRHGLENAWDREIDALEIRKFAAEVFDWRYRSGAKKIVRLLAEPLVSFRLRLGKPVRTVQGYGDFVPDMEAPILQRVYRSRTHMSTDGLSQLQMEIVPIEIVGLDLFAEEPNPKPQQEVVEPLDDEDPESVDEPTAQPTADPQRQVKFYDPYQPEKVWIFETLAQIGVPDVVERWRREQNEKASAKTVSKKSTTRKRKPIDPGMKPGGILQWATVSKKRTDMSPAKQARFSEAVLAALSEKHSPSQHEIHNDLEGTPVRTNSTSKTADLSQRYNVERSSSSLDDLVDHFSAACTVSGAVSTKRRPRANRRRLRIRGRNVDSDDADVAVAGDLSDHEASFTRQSPAPQPRQITVSYSNVEYQDTVAADTTVTSSRATANRKRTAKRSNKTKGKSREPEVVQEAESALASLSISEAASEAPAARSTRTPSPQPRPYIRSDLPEIVSREPEVVNLDLSPATARSIPSPEQQQSLQSPQDVLEFESKRRPAEQEHAGHEVSRSDASHAIIEGGDQHRELPSHSAQTGSKESPSKRMSVKTKPRESNGHVYVISTCDGYWTVDDTKEEEPSSGTRNAEDPKKQDKKKIGRVSIVDLT